MKKIVKQITSVILAVSMILGGVSEGISEISQLFSAKAEASGKIDYSNLSSDQYLAMIFSNNNYNGALNDYGQTNDFPPYSLMNDFYLDVEKASRARVVFNEFNSATDYKTTKGLYEILTFDGSSEVEKVMELEDYYTAIFLSIVDARMSDENFIDNLNCETNKLILTLSSEVENYFKFSAKDTWKTLETQSLEQEDFDAIAEIWSSQTSSKELWEMVGKDIGYITDILSAADTVNDALKNIADFTQLANVNSEVKAVLEQIYLNCPQNNLPMKNAARKVYEYVSNQMTYEIMTLSQAGYAACEYALSEIVGGLWEQCLTAVLGQYVVGVLIGQAVGKLISNYCFATDAVEEQLCAISALVNFEDAVVLAVKALENEYKSQPNDINSKNYVESLRFLMATYDLGCDYVEDFVDTVYTEGAINNVLYSDSDEYNYWITLFAEQETINQKRKSFLYLEKYKEVYKVDAPSAYEYYFGTVDEETGVVSVTSMEITQTKSFFVGDEGPVYDYFKIDYLPNNHTEVILGEFVESSDETVIKIDNSQYIGGYLSVVGEGTCILTFTIYGTEYSKSIEVTVGSNNGSYVSDWAFKGDAYYDSTSNYYVLTPDVTWSSGSIWLYKNNLKTDFSISLDYYSGNRTSGADGLAVVFYNDDIITSGEGEAIMYGGLTGYAVELDTYYNSEPTASNHISINKTQTEHLAWALLPESEDGQWHSLKVLVDDNVCSVYVDGNLKISNEATQTGYGYLGITAATGSQRNLHAVKNIQVEDLSGESNEKTLKSVSVYNRPAKTTYVVGEALSTNGMKLELTYSDGSKKVVSKGFTVSGFNSTSAGTKTVTVSYENLTTSFAVTVTNPVTYTLSYNANGGTGAPSNQTGSINYTISSTVPTRFGYTFLGWSKNPSARTADYEPNGIISLLDSTTLYAVWGSATVISEKTLYSTSINFAKQEVYYTFVPEKSEKYICESTGTLDSQIYIYDSSGNQLGYNDDGSDEGNNFKIDISLVSGTNYYIKVRAYRSSVGETSFKVSPNTYTLSYDANSGTGAPLSQVDSTSYTISNTVPTKFGYTFLGWSKSGSATSATYEPGESIVLAEDTTLYAVWKAATSITVNTAYSTTIEFSNQEVYYTFTPSSTGEYVFSSTGSSDSKVYVYDSSGKQLGYNDDISTENKNFRLTLKLTSGTKYYVKVRVHGFYVGTFSFNVELGELTTYTLSYNANGGAGAPSDYTGAATQTISINVPAKYGYTFLGWSKSNSASSATYEPGDNIVLTEDTTLYAVWKPAMSLSVGTSYYTTIGFAYQRWYYTFTPSSSCDYVFESTGSLDSKIYVCTPSGSRIGYDDDSSDEGYNFKLKINLTSGTQYYVIVEAHESNTGSTSFSVYEDIPANYILSYSANGGTGAPLNQTGATHTISDTIPSLFGHTFLGWSKDSSASSATYRPGDNIAITGNTTLYAVWKANTYTIKYNANGGSGTMSNSSYTYDVSKSLTANAFTRSGYTFLGWSTSSSATTATYTDCQSVKNLTTTNGGTVNLYAVWKENVIYTVRYNANGGTGTMSDSTHISGVYKELTQNAFVRTGYTFLGWATSSTDTNPTFTDGQTIRFTSSTGSTVILYAVWKANTYSVKYNANSGSGTMSNSNHTYDVSKSLTANAFTRSGYTFLGWSTSSSATTATYSNGQSVKNLTSTDGATVNLYAVWQEIEPEVMLGDVNGDDVIDAGDAVIISRYDAGLITLTQEQLTAADINKDGYVDAGDAVIISRYDAGLITTLNNEEEE